MKKFIKYFTPVFILFGLLLFVPLMPGKKFGSDDPASINDPRITASITNDDLIEILKTSRRGNLVSVWEYVTLLAGRSVLSISDSKPSKVYRFKEKEPEVFEEPAIGTVEVDIGLVCGRLCGSGVTIYLSKEKGKWFIVEKHQWVS